MKKGKSCKGRNQNLNSITMYLSKRNLKLFGVIAVSSWLIVSCKKDQLPNIETSQVSQITGTSAICGGTIIDEGGSTIISRGICWSTGTSPTIQDKKTSDGAGAGTFTSQMTNLTGQTTYFVKAYATNESGTSYGMAMSFKTLGQAPTVTTEDASNVTITACTLNGKVNANFLSTVVIFEYGKTEQYGQTVNASQSPITTNEITSVNTNISGLDIGTTYHYRLKAINSLGTTFGDDKTFKTLGNIPTVTTENSNNITINSATLAGTVNPNYLSTSVSFEYGTSASYGQIVTAAQSPISGSSSNNVTASISSLNPGTIYHYRVIATNSLGTSVGIDKTFTTLGQVPTTSTQNANNFVFPSARLNGTVNANYLSTTVTFEYGTSTSYGQSVTATQSPVTGNSSTTVSATITGLASNTQYHFRIKAENSLGITYGNDNTFTAYEIGTFYGGGLICHLDATGQHGIIAAPEDQSSGAPWGCISTNITGTTYTIGSGQSNTTKILNGCNEPGIAARICDELVLNGYSDWYLPSDLELDKMLRNLKQKGLGNFADQKYWASRQSLNTTQALLQDFLGGGQHDGNKNENFYVRAARSF